MGSGTLSIKLRCASWQQLATIYRRDLSRGTMFLKAANPPAIGTEVRIDLTLPSDTVIVMTGTVDQHVTDPQRGSGVELKLAPIPESSVWLIESALAAEAKVRAQTQNSSQPPTNQTPAHGVPSIVAPQSSGPIRSLSDGEDVASAERELITALSSEVESLKKLNPFLILGVGYEATDAEVRSAFGELTKRYHPDRFARYQSTELRQTAAEIFILIRDAYRRIGVDTGRAQVLQSLGRSPAPRAVAAPRVSQPIARNLPAKVPQSSPGIRIPVENERDTVNLVNTPPARPTPPPQAQQPPARPTPTPPPNPTTPPPAAKPLPMAPTERRPVLTQSPAVDTLDAAGLEELLDAGRLDEALAGFKVLAKKNPQDRAYRAGTELCEGLRSLGQRDRLEAAQRFEAALEIDPSNERAARELAEMRRHATNERKGLLSRLMGKKE